MTTNEQRMAKAYGLVGDARKRHANPWSGYTRIPIPALLAAAVWTYAWIGWWSLVPVASVACGRRNPRAFPPRRSFDHWASKAVLGETFWAMGKEVPAVHVAGKNWLLDRMALLCDDALTAGVDGTPQP